MPGDGTYAPKSPDLSSFYSTPAPPTRPVVAASPTNYQPLPRSQQHLQGSPGQFLHLQQQQQSYLHPPQSNSYHPPPSPGASPHRPPPAPADSLNFLPTSHPHQPQPQPLPQQYYPHPPQSPQTPRHTAQPGTLGFSPQQAQGQPYYPVYGGQALSYPAQPQAVPQAHSHSLAPSPFPGQSHSEINAFSDQMPPRRSGQAAPASPVVAPSPVRTKFPTARIKRIMQADEEVGKVAQQTPIAVGKALEMFMIALVTKSADVAKEKNSKRVSAQMLKQVVESDDQWDFLRDIVSRVENEDKAGKAGGRPKAESESDEDTSDAKKKGRGGRKKKV